MRIVCYIMVSRQASTDLNKVKKMKELESIKQAFEDFREYLDDIREEAEENTEKLENRVKLLDELSLKPGSPFKHEETLQNHIKNLDMVNYQIGELKDVKQKIEDAIIEIMKPDDDCQRTYVVDKYKLTIKTGYLYSIDKEEYEIIAEKIPMCFCPVTRRISYDINKSNLRDLEKFGSSEEKMLVASVVSKKPAKTAVTLKANV